MSLSVPNTFGEINHIQYQSNTVRNESIKYSTKWIIKRGPMFWILLSCCNLPLPAAVPRIRNSKFFQRKSPAMLRCKTCLLQIVHFPFKWKFEWWPWISHPTRMSHGSHEPDADESRREHVRAGYQSLGCKQTWSSPSDSESLVSRWVSIRGPEPDAGSWQPNICAHRNTCLQARQWIINIIS